MIAKHINFRNAVHSDIVRLVSYIATDQGKKHRVGDVFVSNCRYDDPYLAAQEMAITQIMNSRAKDDKTYHLLVSFRADDDPPPQSMRRIESAICAALGFAEHQRVAVVHRDTDNIHLHIAINKIHPRRYTIRTPKRDFHTLAKVCTELEETYDLRRDNHARTGKTQGQRDALDMEASSGEESLLSWIQRECLSAMRDAASWDGLHRTLAKFGLTLALRGNGVVIAVGSGARVKGSDVDRAFSKANLEKRFGPFVPRPRECDDVAPEKKYEKLPLGKENPLHDEFLRYRDKHDKEKSVVLSHIDQDYRRKLALLRAENRMERLRIRRLAAGRFPKRDLYRAATDKFRRGCESLRLVARAKRQAVHRDMPGHTWLSWLQEQAGAGHEDALRILRGRAFRLGRKGGATITGDGQSEEKLLNGVNVDAVTKHGTVIYAIGKDALRDEGHAFRLGRDAREETMVMALRLAKERFGEPLHINGSYAFRDKVLRAAVAAKLRVRFADPQLESMRQRMMTFNQPSNQHRRENAR